MGNQQISKHEDNGLFQHERLGPVKIVEFHDNQLDEQISTM